MPAAARALDATSHGQLLPPGTPTVLIGGMPAAAVGTVHQCALAVVPKHPPSAMLVGSSTVLIGGLPALRVGDSSVCGATVIPPGAATVLIGG